MLISSLSLRGKSRNIVSRGGGYWMPIKDVQMGGEDQTKIRWLWRGGRGVRILKFFVDVRSEWPLISEYSSICGQFYLKVTALKLLSCLLRTRRFISLLYIATPKILFRISLSAELFRQEIVLLAHFLRTVRF